MGEYSKRDRVKMIGTRGKINAILWNIKINLQKLVDICGYELPTNLQHFTQKDLTEMKIFLKVLGGGTFFKHPVDKVYQGDVVFINLREWDCPAMDLASRRQFLERPEMSAERKGLGLDSWGIKGKRSPLGVHQLYSSQQNSSRVSSRTITRTR